ncbi:MAG: aminodeoxychorismate/anthranilate synthase component II [Clostridiales Family XIII bacterium]|jgi:anthranilate synthase component 2|nr:aminodeoxychorismate/anthranilate synthase component II [Clostridiales Family XIII bacterium]
MILLVDNYDSFSYNLYQQIGSILQAFSEEDGRKADAAPEPIRVIRNDDLTAAQIVALSPSRIVLSPGPGAPADAGVCIDLIKWAAGRIPIFGVCLGHQAICEAFGATVSYAKELMHGKTSVAKIDTSSPVFRGLPAEITVGRYHSLAALEETMPETLKVTARTDDGEIMAVEHTDYRIYGVQFHPESILTPEGGRIMRNFLTEERPIEIQACPACN